MQMGTRVPSNGQSATVRDNDGTWCRALRCDPEHSSGLGFQFPPQVLCFSTIDGWLGAVRTGASGSHTFLGSGHESLLGLGEHLLSFWQLGGGSPNCVPISRLLPRGHNSLMGVQKLLSESQILGTTTLAVEEGPGLCMKREGAIVPHLHCPPFFLRDSMTSSFRPLLPRLPP